MSYPENSLSNRISVSPIKPVVLQADYYNNFSKYVLSNNKMNTNCVIDPAFNYSHYSKNELRIETYKLAELKHVARHYKLHVSGNKTELIQRILSFFVKTSSAICIQKHFRRNIVKLSILLRGEAFRKPEKCVNECDFYSMEPLSEVPNTHFFSYKDEKGFIYGFDMFSLITLFKKTDKLLNPYNREQFPYEITSNLFGLYKISRVLYPCIFSNDNVYINISTTTRSRTANIRPNTISDVTPTRENTVEEVVTQPTAVYEHIITFDSQIPIETIIQNRLDSIRAQPLNVRIRELFMEINLLGNYAESRWFLDLDRARLARFYQFYYEWWNTRTRLPRDVKANICSVPNPFPDIRLLYVYPTTDIEEFREACVNTMEFMVYGGVDIEYRKLGALQLLSVLTIFSLPARNIMPWLYESIIL